MLSTQTIDWKTKQKINIFDLTVQDLEKYSSIVQQPVYRGWHRMKRQEELLMEEGEEVGDGRAEDCQQQEMEEKLQRHSGLMWLDMRTHICIFESSEPEGLCVGDLLYISVSPAVSWIARGTEEAPLFYRVSRCPTDSPSKMICLLFFACSAVGHFLGISHSTQIFPSSVRYPFLWPEIEPHWEVALNHWTTREVPWRHFLSYKSHSVYERKYRDLQEGAKKKWNLHV